MDSSEKSEETKMDSCEQSDEQNMWNPTQEFENEDEEIKSRRGKVYPRHLTNIEVKNKNIFVNPDTLLFGKYYLFIEYNIFRCSRYRVEACL